MPRSARQRELAVYETAGNYSQAEATGRRAGPPYLPSHCRSWPDFVRHGPPLLTQARAGTVEGTAGPSVASRRRRKGTQFAAPLTRSGAPGERHSVRTPNAVSGRQDGPTAHQERRANRRTRPTISTRSRGGSLHPRGSLISAIGALYPRNPRQFPPKGAPHFGGGRAGEKETTQDVGSNLSQYGNGMHACSFAHANPLGGCSCL